MPGITMTFTDLTVEESHRLVKALGREATMACNHPAEGSSTEEARTEVAHRFVDLTMRTATQSLILDALLSGNGVATYNEVVSAHGGKDGPSLAGCLSSMTKNWRKAGGPRRFVTRSFTGLGILLYNLDGAYMQALLLARAEFKKKKFRIDPDDAEGPAGVGV